jgi:hypothetical protein
LQYYARATIFVAEQISRWQGWSPLLQQREATLQRCGKVFDIDHAL